MFSARFSGFRQKQTANLLRISFSEDNNLYNWGEFIFQLVRTKSKGGAPRRTLALIKVRLIFIVSFLFQVPYEKCRPRMQLTISRCFNCKKARLVDRVDDKWVCFACKQRGIKKGFTKPIDQFVKR